MLGFNSHLLSKMYSLERQANILRFELDVLKRRRAEFMPGPDDLWYRADEQVQVKVRELEPVEAELQTLNEKLLQEFGDAGYTWLREQFPAINRDTTVEQLRDISPDVIRIPKPSPWNPGFMAGDDIDLAPPVIGVEEVHMRRTNILSRESRRVYEWYVGYSTVLNRLFIVRLSGYNLD